MVKKSRKREIYKKSNTISLYQRRIKIILGIIITLFFVLILRLGYIQIIEGEKYSGISDKRRIRKRPIKAFRGKILDRNGEIFADNRHSFDIVAPYKDLLYFLLSQKGELIPRLQIISAHKDKSKSCSVCHEKQELLFKRLVNVLEINKRSLMEIAEKTVRKVEIIKKDVSKRAGKDIVILEEVSKHPVIEDASFRKVAIAEAQEDNFPGIVVKTKPYRWYPNHNLAGHIIGYTQKVKKEMWENYKHKWECLDNGAMVLDYDINVERNKIPVSFCDKMNFKIMNIDRLFALGFLGDILIGKTGIESYYNMILSGNPGERYEELTYENSMANKIILERPPEAGENISLTIDINIQRVAREALGDLRGTVVIMDPWNGEIITMASSPGFNLNTFNKHYNQIVNDKNKPLLNRPIQSTLPPGSTFKIVTAVAALTEKIVTGNQLFKCYGQGGGHKRFRCSSRYGHGMLSVEKAIHHSCNVYFFKVADEMGGKLLHKWGKLFGFGELSMIDIPYERKGILPKPKSVSECKNISIGQGRLLATPVQVTRMIATIANGGKMVTPHIIADINNATGSVTTHDDADSENTLKIPKSVLDIVKSGLAKVVTEGTGRKMGIEEYLVAGKTGTAETHRKNDNHTWFTGYAPYNNPKFCFTVLVEHSPLHAAEATAPVLRPVLAALFPEIKTQTAQE